VPIGSESVAAPGNPVHVLQRGRGEKGRQATLQQLPVVGAEFPPTLLVACAALLQFVVRPRDLDDQLLATL
jgi:hypothetical protein